MLAVWKCEHCTDAGIVDATWEYQLKPWDVTGGCVILQEAGGKLTTMDGQPYRYMVLGACGTSCGKVCDCSKYFLCC